MTKKRNPVISALLSIVNPLPGFMYNGMLLAGAILFAILVSIYLFFFISPMLLTYSGFKILSTVRLITLLAFPISSAFFSIRKKEYKLKIYNKWYLYLLSLIITVAILLSIPLFFSRIKTYRIPTASMQMTIIPGESVVFDKTHYQNNLPQRGDLVAFKNPDDKKEQYVKRCIGLPGDKIEIESGIVYINGIKEEGKYIYFTENSDNFIEDNTDYGIVPKNEVFLLGDNRLNSADSRHFGTVPIDDITGKALYILNSKDSKRVGMTLK